MVDPATQPTPSTPAARIAANLTALGVLRALEEHGSAATPQEQAQLARWSSWGAVPEVFDEHRDQYQDARAQLRGLLNVEQWNAAARTTINAHYTQPSYAAAIWAALEDLGFTGGTVLEPGCGTGTFIGLAPPTARLVGVELDPTTAAIARHLHPAADVRTESFADTRLEQQVDAVVGNVPFADVRLHDPLHNAGNHTMHNHFIVKSLALTKPGGLVAVLTSRYTMDAHNPAARRDIASLGDLVGAVRLPSGAHARTAGTDAVTDLLILRRHDGAPAADAQAWERAEPTAVDGHQVRVNRYFLDHPDQVLGQLAATIGRYSRADLTVTAPDGDLTDHLTSALGRIVQDARDQGLGWNPAAAGSVGSPPAARTGSDAATFVGHIRYVPPDAFTQRGAGGVDEPLAVPASQAAELTRLLHLRDLTLQLLTTEASDLSEDTAASQLRRDLNDAYDEYAAQHGPLNRFTLRRTGRVDATGQDRTTQLRPAVLSRFAADPHSATVFALESFDADTQAATKAAIFTERVVAPRAPRSGADTPADAVAIALDTDGRLELATIARLLGDPEPVARQRLVGIAFDDPQTGTLVTAAEYLSGNVRVKLSAAQTAAATDSAFQGNVEALQAVQPADLGPADIDARLGAAWIGPGDVQAFLRETLSSDAVTVEQTIGADWKVTGRAYGVLATSTYGTERMPATKLAEALLRQRPIKVMDTDADGAAVFNPTETAAAEDKARALNDRFAEWVWQEPARADRLAREYNHRFNALVARSYADTSHMTLPGLASTFAPRPHQLEAVARMIAEPAAGLFHEVGAGKTAEMAMGVWEMRRLGLVRKPAIIVPNHMLDQFSREFLQLYPQAKILAASIADLSADRRRLFVARATTGDWDAIIMTRTAFERLPVSEDEREQYRRAEIEPMRAALAGRVAEADGPTRKRVEKLLLAAEEQAKARLDVARDPGVTFEQTGIDYLVVDELHDYKNLATTSNIPDANITGSGRATDLHMKVEYLRRTHGGRCVTGATATPIANSVTEAYVMQRYLRPDLLREAGIPDFDTWASTFGDTVTDLEMSPDGGSWRMKTRFAKFRNIPEFLRMWAVAADVKTAEDLALPTPPLAARPDGQRAAHTIVGQPTIATTEYVRDLGRRAELVRSRNVDPRDDNMLKISSDGRAAALDMRLVTDPAFTGEPAAADSERITGLSAATAGRDDDPPTKVDVAADRIAALWATHRTATFTDTAGNPHPRPGALQLVFSDLGTPREGWNVYTELRDQLVARGVPAAQVAFIHDASTPRDKERLFERCRTGEVQVLIGSTAKMGVGTNVQARAVALHHLDCPWRPADLAQREGRIVRQGNQNPEVSILRYVTEGTFDTYLWQTVERKAGFIGQIMRGRLDTREIDDIGTNALDYNEVKALASGNPLLLDKAKADAEVARLERLRRAHDRQRSMLEHRTTDLTDRGRDLDHTIARLTDAVAARVTTSGDAFTMTVGPHTHSTRVDAAVALTSHLSRQLRDSATRYSPSIDLGTVAVLGGLPVHARTQRLAEGPVITASIAGLPRTSVTLTATDLAAATDGNAAPSIGVVTRLENRLTGLDKTLADTRADRSAVAAELTRAGDAIGAPFKHRDALTAARATRDRVAGELATSRRDEGAVAAGGSLPARPVMRRPGAGLARRLDEDADSDQLRRRLPEPPTPPRAGG